MAKTRLDSRSCELIERWLKYEGASAVADAVRVLLAAYDEAAEDARVFKAAWLAEDERDV